MRRARTRAPAPSLSQGAPNRPRPVSDGDFLLFQALVSREAGIWLAPSKKALLQGRLERRLGELGVTSWRDYHALVIISRSERDLLLDAITTSETHFFREAGHWEFLAGRLLPAWRAQAEEGLRPRRVRAWSAGCSTGEEPFSLAMVLLDVLPQGWELEVIATDLSSSALEQARRAEWPADRASKIPPAYLERFMLGRAGDQAGTIQAGPALRALVRFERLNLAGSAWPNLGAYDLVMCRNVLMYFDQQTRDRVLARLIDRLAPEGHLFLGHAESLPGGTSRVRALQPTVYALRPPGGLDPLARAPSRS